MAIGPSSRLTAAIMAGKKRVRPFGPSGVRGWKRSAGDAARMPRLSRYTFAGLACSGFASRQILSAAAEGLHVLVGSGPSVVAEPEKSAGALKPSRATGRASCRERVGQEVE